MDQYLKKYIRVIQFNQKDCLKQYLDMNTKLKKEAKDDFEKDFFKLMNNSGFGKTMKNIRNHRAIKQLIAEANYHSCKKFCAHLMAIEVNNKSKNE